MHERQRRLHIRIGQIGKHGFDLAGGQHPLVDQRVARQADDVEELAAGVRDAEGVDRALDALANHIQLALERLALFTRLVAAAIVGIALRPANMMDGTSS